MTAVPFQGPKLKVKRAKRHISDLEAEVSAFLARNPHRLVVEPDPDPALYALVLRMREPIPEDFATYIGDAIHNLRSALDLLTCDLVRLNGGSDKGVYFPFAADAHGLEAAIKDKKVDRASPDVVNIIRALKPYRGGNSLLRAVHELDIADKHKILIPVSHFSGVPNMTVISGGMRIELIDCYVTPVDDGQTIIRVPATDNLKINQELKAVFQIAFDKGQPFEGQLVIPTLVQLADLVDGIVQTFEAHCL